MDRKYNILCGSAARTLFMFHYYSYTIYKIYIHESISVMGECKGCISDNAGVTEFMSTAARSHVHWFLTLYNGVYSEAGSSIFVIDYVNEV